MNVLQLIWWFLLAAHFAASYILCVTYLNAKRRKIRFAILYFLLAGVSLAFIGQPIPPNPAWFMMLMLWTTGLGLHSSSIIRDIRMAMMGGRRVGDVAKTFWGSNKD